MRSALFCLLVLLLCHQAAAQGFNTFSGRNHPELDWQVAETEHFQIMYPQRLEGIEVQAAPIAEASYRALSENLDVSFEEKIRIYLSDEDEIANGFAVPIGPGHTNIWVHTNDVAEIWTGRDKWLRKVIAHELAHIFHFQATRSNIGLLGHLFGNPLPSFWAEGLAQYQTERWDAQRGDRWLRTAVLDDALSYEDGRSIWNSRLRYAVGNAQMRYFTDHYGDSTLVDLLQHRRSHLFGLVEAHDFEAALQATIDQSYREFFDDWRRHKNVYYNTLAGQMEHLDSLALPPIEVPGRYVYDVQYSPDTSRIAAVATPSPQRPVRRLYVIDAETGRSHSVAEGPINPPIAWDPEGERIVFSRQARGQHGSLLNDLFEVRADGAGDLRRLTHSRRAASPSISSDGRLAFVGVSEGTANIFLLDPDTGEETPLTSFTGDVQISSIRWRPDGNRLAFARFADDGARDLGLLDVASGTIEYVTEELVDDRGPVWHPDGSQLAYTSLRDGVPNIFVYDLEAGSHRRLTHLVSGATAHDWLPPDTSFAEGRLAITSTVTKERDGSFRLDASRIAPDLEPTPPEGFATWTEHRPPEEIPFQIEPDPTLITDRRPYNAWQNLTHVVSLGFPYYLGPDYGAGMAGLTSWTEPLGKHSLLTGAALSLIDPVANTTAGLAYVNNQHYATVTLLGYRVPFWLNGHDGRFLVEDRTGGELHAQWPLDWQPHPYVNTHLRARLRYLDIVPRELRAIGDPPARTLPGPASGRQADLQVEFLRRLERPFRDAVIHPLGGYGVRLRVTGAAPALGADVSLLRGDLSAYRIFPAPGPTRLFFYGRARMQEGDPLPQDFLGLTRDDGIQLGLPDAIPITLSDTDRVRGYRAFAIGDRVLFGTAEYRLPLLPGLHTQVLGLVRLGTTSLAAFADGALVWDGAALAEADRRLGIGLEVKNAVSLFGGLLRFQHAAGLAQPADRIGARSEYEFYYRIRAATPF